MLGGLLWKGGSTSRERGGTGNRGGKEEGATPRGGLVAASICSICMNIMGVCDTENVCQANYIPRVHLVSNGRTVPASKVPGFGLAQ